MNIIPKVKPVQKPVQHGMTSRQIDWGIFYVFLFIGCVLMFFMGITNFTSKKSNMKEKMKVAYIAHPISGGVEKNLKEIVNIARTININEPKVVPFAPYFLDCHSLNDDNPDERARGIKNDTFLLKAGFVDEIRLYGPTISKGMTDEIKLALDLNIPVLLKSEYLLKLAEGKHSFKAVCGNEIHEYFFQKLIAGITNEVEISIHKVETVPFQNSASFTPEK